MGARDKYSVPSTIYLPYPLFFTFLKRCCKLIQLNMITVPLHFFLFILSSYPLLQLVNAQNKGEVFDPIIKAISEYKRLQLHSHRM